MRALLPLTLCIVLAFGLAACGKRPGAVDAPEGSEQKAFPRTYPDIQTDPAPRS